MKKNVRIPNTDIEIFPIGLGTVNAGLLWDGKAAYEIFDEFVEMGGNLIDTAHVYSDWVKPETSRSESCIGQWLKLSGRRSQVIIATKGGHPDMTVKKPDLHKSRMKKADMESDLDSSLHKLGTDYIDIYFYHRDDINQTAEELIDVMEAFKKAGKIRYYACSNWSAERMREADEYCLKHGYRGFTANQCLFNIGCKYMKPLADDTLVCADEQIRKYHMENQNNLLMPYTGVCSGFFHKYLKSGIEAVKNSPYYTEGNLNIAKRVEYLCREYNATVSQAVLGFFGQQEFDCVPLYGPRDAKQLKEAMKTFDIPFTKNDYIINNKKENG